MSIVVKIGKRSAVGIILIMGITGCARSPQEKAISFMKSGKSHMEKKDYARAILQFQNAAQATPADAEPYYQLALANSAVGDVRSMIANLRKATELNPKHSAAQLKLAELMTMARSKEILEEAQTRAQGVLSASPDNVEALDTLATAEIRLGKPELAEQHLKEALQKFPQNLKSSGALADLKVSRGDLTGAEDTLKKAVASAPQSVEAKIALGDFYRKNNRPGEAEGQFREALRLDPKNGIALLEISALQERAGQLDKAEETLRQISALPDEQYKPLHASFLYQNGKKDAAIAEFENLARQDPKDRAARTRLIAAYVGAGRTADAEKTISAALHSNPKDEQALMQRSEIYLREGKYTEAEQDLAQLLRFRPDSGEIHYMLSKVHAARGASVQMTQELGAAVRLNPKLLQARLDLAGKMVAEKSARSALNLLNEATAEQQKTAAFIVQRNWVLWALQDRAELRKGIDTGLAIGRLPDLLLQDALLKFDQFNYRGGQASLQEALKLKPDDARLVDAMAASYAAQQQPGKALEVVRKHASERPKSAAAQRLLAEWLSKQGDRAGVRNAFAALKAADPNDASGDLGLAQLDIMEGKLDAARQRLAPFLSWKKDNLWAQATGLSAYVLLGHVEEMAGNHAKAIEHYRRVLDVDDSNVLVLNNLAYVLAEYANQTDEALKYAQRAKEIAPNDAQVADTIGWVFYRKGIYRAAVQHLQSASTGSPQMKYHLAMAYLKAGDRERGEQALQQALRQDPNRPEAKLAKDVLNETLRAAK